MVNLLWIRERTAELEKEIERQRLLELERSKTSELRHQLEMEKERQMQARCFPIFSHYLFIFLEKEVCTSHEGSVANKF